jgi:hypothetical protein
MRQIREKEGMFERLKSRTALALIAAAIAALGVGGVAVAQNASSGPSQHANSAAEAADEQNGAPDNSASDSDNVQSGADDAETNDQPGDDGSSEGADKSVEHSSGHEKEDPGTDMGEK